MLHSSRPEALPQPAPAAAAHSAKLAGRIRREIAACGGWIGFARYMELALYAPGLGYYAAGATKFGPAGDFVTAPELSPLFARTLSRQVAQLIREGLATILEFGAGSGALAAELLDELDALGAAPAHYLIIEASGELRARQQARLGERAACVQWLDTLPSHFSGIVLANEVLDAMPVHAIRTRDDSIDELGVTATDAGFAWSARPAQGELLAAATVLALPADYATEIALVARAFVHTLAAAIERGVVLLVDYGFPAHEFYHPQRAMGTLMCHYRHRAHHDPFFLPGLQDITAHVDFSALAAAATQAGLDVLGYCSQAQFLINCGITEVLAETSPVDIRAYLPQTAAAQKLLSPAEMGELFKTLALGKGCDTPLLGFAQGDRRAVL